MCLAGVIHNSKRNETGNEWRLHGYCMRAEACYRLAVQSLAFFCVLFCHANSYYASVLQHPQCADAASGVKGENAPASLPAQPR